MPHTYKLPSGTWRVIVKCGGITRTGTAPSKREVERVGAKLLLELSIELGRGQSHVSVADIIGMYVTNGEPRWSPTYLAEVEAVIDDIPEAFTKRHANSVRARDVTALYRQLAAQGWAAHRLKRLHTVLHKTWKDAVEFEELVDANIVENVRTPKVPDREVNAPSHDTVATIIAAATGLEHLAIRLAAATGARRGEIVALQWRDIELDPGTVTIRRSLRYTPATGVVEGSTKTGAAGHRRVIVDAGTRALLADWAAEQAELAAVAGFEPRWVFSDNAGHTPWRPDRLSHAFVAACRRAGVTGVRLHDIRHYVATSMLQAGKPAIEVAGQLGHSTPITTLRVYAHYMPGTGRDSAEDRAAHWGTG